MAKKQIKVTLVRSPIGIVAKHRGCVSGLGLKKMQHSVILEDTRSIRGRANKINYLVRVEEV